MLICLAGTAKANEQHDQAPKNLPAREILMREGYVESGETQFSDRFHLTKKFRVEYRQEFRMGEQKLLFKVYGPIVKKRPGIGFKLKGIKIKDHSVEVKGYGNMKKTAILFTVLF